MSNLTASRAQPRRFQRTALALCIMTASAAMAQQTEPQLEEIQVLGVKGSLQNAQDMKRDSATVIDAISASDINALPDKSVLEALQRVPGVSIENFAAAEDPDHFSIEGSGATLRGMPQTRSEFNGRDSFSANNGRGLSFQDVPPELMGSVEVFKNQTADMIEGGISGTINLNTRKPFDSEERQIAVNGALNYSDLAEATNPDLSGIFSDRWQTELGEFGLLVSLANSKLESANNSMQNGLNTLVDVPGVGQRWTPINAGARQVEQARERTGGSLALQWADPSGVSISTLEYLQSDARQTWLERAVQSDDTVGTASADSQYSGNQFVAGRLEGAEGYNSYTRRSDQRSKVEDLSFNIALMPSDQWTVTFDAQYVKARNQVTDLSIFGHLPADVFVDYTGSHPEVAFVAPASSGQTDAEYFTDPANFYYRAAMDHLEDSEGDEKALQLDVEYQLDNPWLHSVKAGVRASDRDQTTRWSTYNWSVLSESWAGGKKYFNGVYDSDPWDGQPGTETYAAPNYDTVSFDDFYRGQAAGVSGGRILAPSADLVSDYDRFKTELSSIFGFNHLQTRDDLVRDSYLPVEINGVNERRSAAYLMLNFGSPEDTWVGNAGLRYVTITNKTDGGVAFADFGDSTLLLPADDIAFMNGATYAADARNSSSEWLPSLNLKYNINDDWLMRFGYSKAVAFPDMGNLRNYMGIYAVVQEHDTDNDGQADTGTVSEYRAGTGNPYLEPMRADNFDITLEWYFDDVGAVSAGLFYKEMSNYFSAGAYPQSITNNGITQTVEVDGPVNAGAATIKGIELAYQQFFEDLPGAWSGLGVQANYTYLANNGAPNQNLRPDDGSVVEVVFDDLPLQGMSEHTYNLVGMYEYQGLSARLAWNWRSEYLLTTRDVITKLPIYNAPEGQLDGSIFYTINDHIKIGVQATNLLNKTTRTKMQVAQDGTKVDRSWFINDRRFDAVVRLTF